MEYFGEIRKRKFSVAIIGCGASAVLILRALCDRAHLWNKKLSINIFEKNNSNGRGIAYQSKIKHLILNTTANSMSMKNEEPDDFIRWLSSMDISPVCDIPRGIYGDYLEQELKNCIDQLRKNGNDIVIYRKKVEYVKINKEFAVGFSGREIYFDNCIIATGGEVVLPDNLCLNTESEVLSIFDEEKIRKIKKRSKVAIIGSGQSAIDACIMMEYLGVEGFYTLISRNGVLPRVRNNKIDLEVDSTIIDTEKHDLEFILNYVNKSIYWKCSEVKKMVDRPASFRLMKIDLLRSLRKVPSWQKSMMLITPYINNIWSGFTSSEKKFFSKNYQKEMYYLRSAIMPESASRFLDIYNNGKLGVLWGGDYFINKKSNGFNLSKKDALIHFDYVINASGIKAISHLKLLDSEIKLGRVSVNKFNGLCIDHATMQLMNFDEEIHNGLYSIGYPTQGSVLISNSIELLRQSAVKIAINITKYINKE